MGKNIYINRQQPHQQAYESSLKLEWMTAKEVSQHLKVSVGSVRNMTYMGSLPFTRIGRRVRYLRQDIDALLLENKRRSSYGY